MNNEIKLVKKKAIGHSKKDELTNNDKKFLKLVEIAGEIVLKEDELLFKELAKY